jgi:protein-tyrosine-phosphatase
VNKLPLLGKLTLRGPLPITLANRPILDLKLPHDCMVSTLSKQRSRAFEVADFNAFEHILVMDSANHVNVCALAKHPEEKDRVQLILEASFPGHNKPVPDPYYGGDQGFESVYQLLAQASEDWLDQWL